MPTCMTIPLPVDASSPAWIGDPTALLGETDDLEYAAHVASLTPAGHSRAPAAGNPAKVNLSEVRLQLQRQLKQQVGGRDMGGVWLHAHYVAVPCRTTGQQQHHHSGAWLLTTSMYVRTVLQVSPAPAQPSVS